MPPREKSAQDPPDIDAHKLTVGALVRLVACIFTVVSVTVSGVWFAAAVKSDVNALNIGLTTLKQEVATRAATRDKEMADIKASNEREVAKLEKRADKSEQATAEMARKLDVALALLERIDAKVCKP